MARARDPEDEVPRPLCGCGKHPATHQVKLSVQRLELDRESGVRSRPYWSASFRGAHTNIEALVCDECLSSKINLTVAVDATVEKAKPVI